MKLQAVLFSTVLLAACSQQPGNAEDQPMPEATQQPMPNEAPSSADTTATAAPSAADMQMSEAEHKQMAGNAAATMAMATGIIESVDTGAGKITIAHGPVEALTWPAMTMAFKASPEQLASAKPGQKVEFEFESKGMDNTITRIKPMK
ncbi:copper-binding protein [Stenotrophomonas sp.]|uniref:copper-binding protein n=1 Tax=Stenotrophomonas sp. TaxID=69392 RepID=UPI0025F95126|nr:copper-binding protein [Stenotrophomonas sp.]MBW8373141.1 copper-binding protein [Stenotrophomonas sp.]